MKLTDHQEALLATVRDEQERHELVKSSARTRAEQFERELIAESLIRRDRAAAIADAAGVPRRQIGIVGLKNKDGKTVRKAIEHGTQFLMPGDLDEPEETTNENFTFEGDRLDVTLRGDDFEPYRSLVGDVTLGGWIFEVKGNSLLPIDADQDATWQEPVVQVVMANDGVWQKRALEFVKEAGEA